AYSVWQYYLLDHNNRFVNRGAGVVYFNNAQIEDNWTVIWRQLDILSGPTSPPMKAMGRLTS
ncbi:MAG: hypothetical protein AAGJ87_05215, partial [Pseudomonadota bacterium]